VSSDCSIGDPPLRLDSGVCSAQVSAQVSADRSLVSIPSRAPIISAASECIPDTGDLMPGLHAAQKAINAGVVEHAIQPQLRLEIFGSAGLHPPRG